MVRDHHAGGCSDYGYGRRGLTARLRGGPTDPRRAQRPHRARAFRSRRIPWRAQPSLRGV